MNEDSSISCRGNIDLITLYGINEIQEFSGFFQVESLYQYCILLFNITSYWYSLSICKSFGTKNIKGYLVYFNRGLGPLGAERSYHLQIFTDEEYSSQKRT